MTKKQSAFVTALGILVFVLLFLNTQRYWMRFDLSSGKAYTLSKTSQELYKEIDERVTITYYLSDRLLRMHPAPNGIIDVLREYEAYSHGRIRVLVEDPSKKASAASAERLGVVPQRFQTYEQDQSSLATVYSGIVVEYLNRTETIPAAFSIETLEYDLSSRIRSLVRNTRRSVGIVVAAGNMDWKTDFGLLADALESNGYEARELKLDKEIPSGLSALFVFGGVTELGDFELSRLDSYIGGGGGVLFAVEAVIVDSKNDLRALPVQKSHLFDMLQKYGVKVQPELALDKASLSIPYQTRSPAGTREVRLLRYPHWIALLADNVSKTHPLTSRFSGLDLYWPSPLQVVPVAGVRQEIVAYTTGRAWRMKKELVTNPELETAFNAEENATKGKIPLVIAMSGSFPRAIDTQPARAEVSPQPARIVIIADSDFAGPLVQVSRSERNLDFAVTVADWLSGDDDMLKIRNKASRSMRLDRISDPVERTRNIVGAQAANVIFVPLAVVAFGVLRALKRRKNRQGTRS